MMNRLTPSLFMIFFPGLARDNTRQVEDQIAENESARQSHIINQNGATSDLNHALCMFCMVLNI